MFFYILAAHLHLIHVVHLASMAAAAVAVVTIGRLCHTI